jgi:hypothetical protein
MRISPLFGALLLAAPFYAGALPLSSDESFARQLHQGRADIPGQLPPPKPAPRPIKSDPLLEAAQAVARQISDHPAGLDRIFDQIFFKEYPKENLIFLFQKIHKSYGEVTSVSLVSSESSLSGHFSFVFKKHFTSSVRLKIISTDSGKISGFLLKSTRTDRSSMAEVLDDLRKLPGKVNFRLARLGSSMEPLYDLNPDVSLAIGSTFKLYILGALVQNGQNWDEIFKIREDLKSLPSGTLHTWPAGSPISAYDLASRMISQSDNTATDHLLHHAGRRQVERMMGFMGNAAPQRSFPFLYTLEMFKIKSDETLSRKFLDLNVDARRTLLDGEVRAIPRESVMPWSEPRAVDSLEWFASASDLCRMMNWFLERNDQTALKIMAINPVLDIPKDFAYAGAKGGSEPGVLNLTFLLKSKKGETFALSAAWNNPSAGLDDLLFFALVQSAIDLIPQER